MLKPRFRINGKQWRVNVCPIEGALGLTDQEKREIHIQKDMSEEQNLAVFMHEFLHASLFELHLSGPTDILNHEVEEIICEGLARILIDNFNIDWKKK